MPTRRRDVGVGRRSHGASVAVARERGEESASTHRVAVSRRCGCTHKLEQHRFRISRQRTSDERNSHGVRGAVEQIHGERVGPAISPLALGERELRLRATLSQIRRDVHLEPKLLREDWRAIRLIRLWVTPRDEDTAIIQEL